MPESRKGHRDQGHYCRCGKGHTAEGLEKGRIDVRCDEGGEGDMPALPELNDGSGPIGPIEIARNLYAEEHC